MTLWGALVLVALGLVCAAWGWVLGEVGSALVVWGLHG